MSSKSIKPEDHWSCIAHLSAENMLKSAFIEEKKFKHSPGVGADNPKFWYQQETLITMVICCKFKKNLQSLTLYMSFHDLINIYSWRSGLDNPRGQNFDVNRNLLSVICYKFQKNLFEVWFHTIFFHDFIHVYSPRAGADNPLGTKFWCQHEHLVTSVICCKFQKHLFEVWFYTLFFMILYMYIAPGRGQTAPRGQNFDVNRNVLSFHCFVTSLKKMSLKPDSIQFSSWFNTCI